MKKIVIILLLFMIMTPTVALGMIFSPDDIPIYMPMKPRADGRPIMSQVFNKPNGRLLGDAVGDTMEANYGWGQFFIDGDETRAIYVIIELISFDHYILQAYYNFMIGFHERGYSYLSPIVKEDMAATMFVRHLSDQTDNLSRDNAVFTVRTFVPTDSLEDSFQDYNIALKMDLGAGYFSSNKRKKAEDAPHYLDDIAALNYVLRQGASNTYYTDFLYMDKEKVALKFATLEDNNALNAYMNVEVHIDGNYLRESSKVGNNGEISEDFKAGGVVRINLGTTPQYIKNIRKEVYQELDYYQDIGRLRGGYDHYGVRYRTETKFNFNSNKRLVFEDISNRDYSIYDKYAPEKMIQNYIDLQEKHPDNFEGYTWRWHQLY